MNFDRPDVARLINQCIQDYKKVVSGIANQAQKTPGRASGGMIRAEKGKLVETISKKLLRAAWLASGQDSSRLIFNAKRKYDIPIRPEYIEKIADPAIRNEIQNNIGEYKIKHGTDIHVCVDKKFVLSVECKTYTENAMMKRVLFDALLLKTQFPNLRFALIQMESQLTGDYSELLPKPLGSKPTHTLMSHIDDVDLKVITLLEGERRVKRPIHVPEFYKPMTKDALNKAVTILAGLLKQG